jgi:hypothetical protein
MGRLSKIRLKSVILGMIFILSTIASAKTREAKVFPATRDSVTEENATADRAGVNRYLSTREVADAVSSGALVPITWARVSPKVPGDRRYLRQRADDFLSLLELDFYYETGTHLVVDSAVRSADIQQRLAKTNRNAAPANGARASSHERGTTFDLSRRMKRENYRWLLVRLAYYRGLSRILVIEEKNCIHICVREDD